MPFRLSLLGRVHQEAGRRLVPKGAEWTWSGKGEKIWSACELLKPLPAALRLRRDYPLVFSPLDQ